MIARVSGGACSPLLLLGALGSWLSHAAALSVANRQGPDAPGHWQKESSRLTELTTLSRRIGRVTGEDKEDKDETEGTFPAGAWQNDYQASRMFGAALSRFSHREPTKAAILYVQMGPWPPYIKYVVRSAADNTGTTFYFIGPHFEELDDCDNCMWLPFDLAFAKKRIQKYLGASEQDLSHLYPTKLCDFKPMWPTLFPEITARHEWLGFADHDIIFGDLDSEIEALPKDAELLVPRGFFPQPLANGNFMLFRTTPKMLEAFKRASNWDAVIRDHNYLGFDEWWGVKPSMMEVFMDMHIGGNLAAVPTIRPLIQDFTVTKPGGMIGAGVDQNATVQMYWHNRRLTAKRRGMCVCPDPNSWQHAFMPLSGCPECIRQPEGGLLPEITVNRAIEAFGFHFQAWKKKKGWKECKEESGDCSSWMPTCPHRDGFHFGPRGFSCWSHPPKNPPRFQAEEGRARKLWAQQRQLLAQQQQVLDLEDQVKKEQGTAAAAAVALAKRSWFSRLFFPSRSESPAGRD